MLTQQPSQNGLSADHEPISDGLGQTAVASTTTGSDAGRASTKPTKREAVRLALDAGHQTAKTGIAWIKDQYNLDVTENTFNAYKSSMKHEVKKDDNLEPPHEKPIKDDLELLEAMKAVKALVKRLGGDMVKGIVDLLES